MALVQHSFRRISSMFTRLNVRYYSKTDLKCIKKSVFISQSNDVYTNLALEQWLYKNFDFKNHHLLMLWQNDPCVVIGRNQNPWSETNFSELNTLTENGINLARRTSSGGGIYQDNGNLNLTFFSPRDKYNSELNMEVVSRGIFREFGLKVNLSSDGDLLLRNNKQISSKAVKLGRDNSYHSISLMVKSNKVNLGLAFQDHDVEIKSKAERIPTNVKMMNLCEESPDVTTSSAMKAIGWEFLRTRASSIKDGGMELANQQNGFHLVNPTDSWFPGLKEIRDNYSSWDWCFGKTPKFDISKTFVVPGDLIHNNTGSAASLKVTMAVENGRIADITLFVPYGLDSLGFTGEAKVIHELKGKKFSVEAFQDLEKSLGNFLDEKDKFVTECLKQVMTC